MRFAVQQLLGSSAAVDLFTRALQRVRSRSRSASASAGVSCSVRDQPLSLCDSFHEVRRRDLDASHAGVQALQRVCVGGW